MDLRKDNLTSTFCAKKSLPLYSTISDIVHGSKSVVRFGLIKILTCFYGNEAKYNKNKIRIQNGPLKKTEFFKIINSHYFFLKISWIGPWIDAKSIDVCSSTYMVVRLSDISSKKAWKHKKCISPRFWAYVGQPHGHIGWATSMPLVSINPINPKTNPWNFHEKVLRIGSFEISVVLNRPFWFFLSKKEKIFCLIPVNTGILLP